MGTRNVVDICRLLDGNQPILLGSRIHLTIGYGYPGAAIQSAQTFVLLHLLVLGWLTLLLYGALFQFVPVLVAHPLFSDSLPLPTLACSIRGMAALHIGFLQLDGAIPTVFCFLPATAVLLAVGFGLAIWNLGRTLWNARPLPLPARFVAVGLCSFAATVALGTIFILVLIGVTHHPQQIDFVARGAPLHALARLGGWLTFTAMGVTYRLLAIFMLAPELDGPRSRAGFHCGTAMWVAASLTIVLRAAGLLGLCAFVLYGAGIL